MDFLTQQDPTGLTPTFDWAIVAGDLATDDGLQTAVIISLFTDRLADADDVLPSGDGDRRGWWGDSFADPMLPPLSTPDLIGSRLWLYARAKQTNATMQGIIGAIEEALAWLVEDGVAQQVTVTGRWTGLGAGQWPITIARLAANGTVVDHRYDVVWNAQLGFSIASAPSALPPPPVPVLATASGAPIVTASGQEILI